MTTAQILPQGLDINKILRGKGPVVKCVLLKASGGGNDSKPSKNNDDSKPSNDDESTTTDTEKRVVLVDQMEELEIDTTPKKQMVHKLLGGSFTFCGQYEDEGIVLMARKIDDDGDNLPPINPHVLQPPLDKLEIRGDILIIKVAETPEELDEEDGRDVIVPTNDEFFLDYTKEEFVAFASRTDVVAPERPVEESDAEEEEEDDDDDDEEYDALEDDDDGEPDEEERTGLMNLLMRSILRKFTEDNGRGPDTRELLEIRSALASKMGIPMADIPSMDDPVTKKKPTEEPEPGSPSILTKRREEDENDDDDVEEVQPLRKRVKFGHDEEEKKGE